MSDFGLVSQWRVGLWIVVMACGLTEARAQPMTLFRWEAAPWAYRVKIVPAVAQVDRASEIVVDLSRLLNTPDPRFGDRKPVSQADLKAVLYMLQPAAKGPPVVLGRRLVRMRDVGSFGFHVSLPRAGVWGVKLFGTAKGYAESIECVFVLPVGQSQVPAAFSDRLKIPGPAALPAEYATADDQAGQALCEQLCRKDVSWSLPAGSTPRFLSSGQACGLDDRQLLAAFVASERSKALSQLEVVDLVHYLRQLHLHVSEFFPQAGRFSIKAYQIDRHGRQRLKEALNHELDASLSTMTVATVYRPSEATDKPELQLVPQIPRLLDGLKPKDKLGYVVLTSYPGRAEGYELAVAMDVRYAIVAVVARNARGERVAAFNRMLATFVGQGRFNDVNSLAKGEPTLRSSFAPIYLAAAEAATMFLREEQDRFIFDAALEE